MSAAAVVIIVALGVIIVAIPAIVAMALSTLTRPAGNAAGRTSALIGLRGWHGCHLDAAGRTVWVDPVARSTVAEALAVADVEMRRAGGAR